MRFTCTEVRSLAIVSTTYPATIVMVGLPASVDLPASENAHVPAIVRRALLAGKHDGNIVNVKTEADSASARSDVGNGALFGTSRC